MRWHAFGSNRSVDRHRLLSGRRHAVLDLAGVHRYGLRYANDEEYLALYGLSPTEWYSRGVRICGRTAVELTRDLVADRIGRDVASLVGRAPGVHRTVAVDPFLGSGNTLYWVSRHVAPSVAIGFEADEIVFRLTQAAVRTLALPIDVVFGDFHDRGRELGVQRGDMVVMFLSPPWGRALTHGTLDLRFTTPPVAEVIRLARASFAEARFLFAVHALQDVVSESVSEVIRELDWSTVVNYDISPSRPALVLGTSGWTPKSGATVAAPPA